MKKERQYEVGIKISIPFVVNVEAKTIKEAGEMAEGLVEDVLDNKAMYELRDNGSFNFESGIVDRWGNIEIKKIINRIKY